MEHFNFVIGQNAKWGHAGFYIDHHRMTSLLTCAYCTEVSNQKSKYAYRKIFFYKKSTGYLTAIVTIARLASKSKVF